MNVANIQIGDWLGLQPPATETDNSSHRRRTACSNGHQAADCARSTAGGD